MNEEERHYNLAEFAAAAPTGANPGESMAARVGLPAPDFSVPTVDGAMVHLSDLRGKRHVVMMTGAVTSPMCAFEVPAFNELHQEFVGRGVSFFPFYTRESHPAENYPSHRVLGTKAELCPRPAAVGEGPVSDYRRRAWMVKFIGAMASGPTPFSLSIRMDALSFAATWRTIPSYASFWMT